MSTGWSPFLSSSSSDAEQNDEYLERELDTLERACAKRASCAGASWVSSSAAATGAPGASAGRCAPAVRQGRLIAPAARRLRPAGRVAPAAPPVAPAPAAQTARRPANARPRVTSSAYSRSPPTGRPEARRVTATSGARARRPSAMCSAVASPVVVGFVASTTSRTGGSARSTRA